MPVSQPSLPARVPTPRPLWIFPGASRRGLEDREAAERAAVAQHEMPETNIRRRSRNGRIVSFWTERFRVNARFPWPTALAGFAAAQVTKLIVNSWIEGYSRIGFT
ncbi:hypothetical protein [Tropicimonas sediminicola]|uniref:hypothetical protein n=1 Tax=Tropicimonas sediminicola TaxID=1031541 RepID=UPI000B78F8F9|nr:hypothetical protein [Tropicimonas sediminicola]